MVVLVSTNNLLGTDGDDILLLRRNKANIKNILIAKGFKGDDIIIGSKGKDQLGGGSGNDFLFGGSGKDTLKGGSGNDVLLGGKGKDLLFGGKGDDVMKGGSGNDRIFSRFGADVLDGGKGNDYLRSVSDNGEPIPEQDPNGLVNQFGKYGTFSANDTLTGGKGKDTFEFRFLLDAKVDVLLDHIDDDGDIDWRAVAGRNDGVHQHWVNSISDDIITDFEAGKDKIKLVGHTVAIESLVRTVDNRGEDITLITVRSDQGADGQGGGGSHDLDGLGSISVYGDPVSASDIQVSANVFHGSFSNISDII